MKVRMNFDMSDPEVDDKQDLEIMMAGSGMASTLWSLLMNGRKNYEAIIESGKVKTAYELLDLILEDVADDLFEQGININQIYQ